MTITETAATTDAGDAAFRWLVPDQRGVGLVANVQRQHSEAPADDSQGNPLDLFTPKSVQVVVKPPE